MRDKANNLFSLAFMFASWAFALQVLIYRGASYVNEVSAHEIEHRAEREFMRPEWLNDKFQVRFDEVEIFINDEQDSGGGMCYINRWGEVYINWGLDDKWTALVIGKDCMAHEVGHWVDRQNGYPSGTEEFQRAIDLAARMDWGIDHFPCITGKVCEDDEWGGYGEIYADLFERKSIGDIPAILWDWYLPYYPVGEESL